MTISYDNVNWVRLGLPAHHLRKRLNNVVVADALEDGYPRKTKHEARYKAGTDKDGRTVWQPVLVFRGIDRRIARAYNEKYSGMKLRAIRAIKGVGRPWLTLLNFDQEPRPSEPTISLNQTA